MLASEVRQLREKDELFIAGSKMDATFVAGPFEDGTQWMALIRFKTGALSLMPLTNLRVKPPTPKQGETWSKRGNRLETRYIAAVADGFVITKAHAERPDSAAHLYTVDDFIRAFRPN